MRIINETSHRPFPLPSKKWIMRQSWRNVLFTHWAISPVKLRQYIPTQLQIDTFHHDAWVGIVVFAMEGIYPSGLRKLSLTPSFSEINVRTYVQYKGKPGIYFLSLDVNDWASLTIARRWYRLPYSPANISYYQNGKTFHCESIRKTNTFNPIRFNGRFTPLPNKYYARKGSLDHWLTERYCMYTNDKKGNIYSGDIHHLPWPLQNVKTETLTNTLFSAFHFDLNIEKSISHFSTGVDTIIWNIEKLRI